jgi:hypothetical protein
VKGSFSLLRGQSIIAIHVRCSARQAQNTYLNLTICPWRAALSLHFCIVFFECHMDSEDSSGKYCLCQMGGSGNTIVRFMSPDQHAHAIKWMLSHCGCNIYSRAIKPWYFFFHFVFSLLHYPHKSSSTTSKRLTLGSTSYLWKLYCLQD